MATLAGRNLVCTANDVRIAGVARDAQGNPLVSPNRCTRDTRFNLTATFELVTTSSERYDIGMYFDIGGDPENNGARTGTCSLSTLPTGPLPFRNLDGDFCGDTVQNTNPLNPLLVTITIPNVLCTDDNSDGLLDLPNCVSWEQNSGSACGTETDAFPGSPSKCKCDDAFNVPVLVERPNITVDKTANPTALNEPGGPVTFTVTVTNPAAVTNVTLTTIVDDPDNDPATSNSITYQASIICAKTLLLGGQTPPDSTTCTFTRNVSGNPGDNITDRACVNGIDSNKNPVGPACDIATVSIRDVSPTAAVTKTVDALLCSDVRFKVKVENTGTAESLTLSALSDNQFGNIAQVGGLVLATNCSVPQTIQPSGFYQCTFEASVCSSPHTDTVTATLADNDGNQITRTGSASITISATTP